MRITNATIEFFCPGNMQPTPVWADNVDLQQISTPEGRQQFLVAKLFPIAFKWASEHWGDHRCAKWEYVRHEGTQPDKVNVFESGRWIGSFQLVITNDAT